MENFKKMLSGRQFTYYATTSLMVIAVIGILLVINLFADKLGWFADLTVDKRFTVSEETKKFLSTLNKDVKIVTFANEENSSIAYVKNTLEQYKGSSPKLTVENFDPDKNPLKSKQYNLNESSGNIIIVECGKRTRTISLDDVMYDLQQGKSKMESQLTSAIAYVVSNSEIKLYFLQGHGEIKDTTFTVIKTRMEENGIKTQEIDLSSEKAVPQDASVVAIVGPKSDIGQEEKVKLDKYLQSNGKAIVLLNSLLDVKEGGYKNIAELLKPYNIAIDNDLVVEASAKNQFAQTPIYFKPDLKASDITNSIISNSLRFSVTESRSLRVLTEKVPGLVVTPLATTSEKAWGETDVSGNSASQDENDVKGPMNVVVQAEKTSTDGKSKSRIVVYGNASSLLDNYISVSSSAGNVDMFVNSLKWLADIKETINIATKDLKVENVTPTELQFWLMLFFAVLLPLGFAVAGTTVWVVRKRL